MYGLFIKRERLAQNMSQEALCHGICAVSYLSKIENGKVQPNHEIILKLMSALNMVFPETQEETDHIQKELGTLLDLAETG
ncbi:MAG: HTH-type transcriptional regulator, quorum sensing regulator NprR, partial [Clostridiales bacterium]|nr:HTH-type transcriptional regulator, quorum sensing regulator NprR [Clostridiales bacterium]